MKKTMSRKQFLLGAGAVAGASLCAPGIARAARPITIKLGIDLLGTHPITLNLIEVAKRIDEDTKGRVKLEVFANNELGNDTHMLSQVRSGAIQMMAIGDNIIAELEPSAAIDNIGFAFKNVETAWRALDGKVGEIVAANIAKTGLYPMRKVWDLGFRDVTTGTKPIHTPLDLKGFKIRVPPSPISVSLFQHLGAAPTSLNFAEVYTALQTKVVDGEENSISVIESERYYQVQKFCSLTHHMWVGYWMVMNGTLWQSLSPTDRKIITTAFNEQAPKQRIANNTLNNSVQTKLEQQGLRFNAVDPTLFQNALIKSGFYAEWQTKFSPNLWTALESYTGKLS